MATEKSVGDVLGASEMGETYLFDTLEVELYDDDAIYPSKTLKYEGAIDCLRDRIVDDALPEDEQYWVWKKARSIPDRIEVYGSDDFQLPMDYDWPIIVPATWDRPYSANGEKTDPPGVIAFPQYFVATRDKRSADFKDGDYVALIDRHLKYIAVREEYQDDDLLMDALNDFAFVWEQNTTYGGELEHPNGENVPLDTVKILL